MAQKYNYIPSICFIIVLITLILVCWFASIQLSDASTEQKTVYITVHYSYDVSVPITITSLIEDIDRNNEIDFSDINLVRAAYGSFPGDASWNKMADVDKNGQVDFTDINLVRAAYGERLVMK